MYTTYSQASAEDANVRPEEDGRQKPLLFVRAPSPKLARANTYSEADK